MRPSAAHVHRRWLIVVAVTVLLTVMGSAAGWADPPRSDRGASSAARGGGNGPDSAKERGPAHGKQRGASKPRHAAKKRSGKPGASSSSGKPGASSRSGKPGASSRSGKPGASSRSGGATFAAAETKAAPGKSKGKVNGNDGAKGNVAADSRARGHEGHSQAKGKGKDRARGAGNAPARGAGMRPRGPDRGPLAAQNSGASSPSGDAPSTIPAPVPASQSTATAATPSADAAVSGSDADGAGSPPSTAGADVPGAAERLLGRLPAAVDRATRTVLRDAAVASRSFDVPTALLLALLGYLIVQRWLDRGPLPVAGAPATGEPDDDDAHLL